MRIHMASKRFTIIELLTAVALTVLIGLIVSLAFHNTQMASQRATANINYMIQGRAIMDMLATDLENIVIGSSPNPLRQVSGSDYQLDFKTILPVTRSHYEDPSYSGTGAIPAATNCETTGFYVHNVIHVSWFWDNSAKKLYRYASPAYSSADTNNVRSKNAKEILAMANFACGASTISTLGTVVCSSDFRLSTNTSGTAQPLFTLFPTATGTTNTTACTVLFTLTNAPSTITTKGDAVDAGYVWVDFERTFPLTPYK